ncbi:hypothetical protein EXU29_14020 [Acinetobacter wuhouensis]|uniref:pentapeptide repeat-containing protein n=1 Tax=Acinetobacter wuhouensis TaxID=1879050 RepID=UPI001022C35B|nr:pentapeptide repeat-containing protein [Acinetobacter wuhouensis]RZG71369.1 hypothetical protein EXU29_14020 [Acinetobacter wuhouensis]
MEKTNFAETILEKYQNGQRYFTDYDLYYENFDDQNLADIVFENCFIASSFKRANLTNAKFIHSNIKTNDFSFSNLTNAHFEHLEVDGANFTIVFIDEIYSIFITNVTQQHKKYSCFSIK